MKKYNAYLSRACRFLLLFTAGYTLIAPAMAQTVKAPIVPSQQMLNRPFGSHDTKEFKSPQKVFYPETWFHFIGGNVSHEGITADLEAIADGGFSGIQLFHGQFGGPWPGVEPQIACLSPLWENAVKHTAEECRRLGLRFTMQNCPGWAMSGGPWIEPSNAMRHLVWSRTDVHGGSTNEVHLSMPQPSEEDWRDYQDIAVIAFPTPEGDTGEALKPRSVAGNKGLAWEELLSGNSAEPLGLAPSTKEDPHWVEVSFVEPVLLRTVEFPSINSMNHGQCYEPGVTVMIQALMPNGKVRDILQTDLPQANWQDDRPVSLACPEVPGVSKYRISIVNKHDIAFKSLRLFSAARQNNWEAEAGWTLRSIERNGEHPAQSSAAYIDTDQIVDITDKMDGQGRLNWTAPAGRWTVLRIGHVNTGMRNGPAPAEGTGWECNKLSETGPNVQFANYIGRLAQGPLTDGLLGGMLMDSWECSTQTWTPQMEQEFERVADYPLRKWLPAVMGYVVSDPETTKRFLHDWRATIGDLFANKFFGRMASLAKENGLSITYETAAGDVFPADILEYHKHADVPMCEFWQPMTDGFVGSLNFKPIKPTASAARMYGKPRVAAEAFTSFNLTWDEHLEMLKEVANINTVEGVTHMVFHTYTHNPRTDFLPPGTSFGSGLGTPFLRGQTWWKYISEFNAYLSRCSYMLERGKPVSDVLWYLGDEINHKPDQNYPFPEGYKYDYCNPDVLINRLSVRDGMLTTPEGITYRVLWMPDTERMLPETLEKLYSLISGGATVIGDAPKGIVTLKGGKSAQKRFDAAVKKIWGKDFQKGVRNVGKGRIVAGLTLDVALTQLQIAPDVTGGEALWAHRRADGAEWYFVCTPKSQGFHGTLNFRAGGTVQLWDPVTGEIELKAALRNGNFTSVELDLPRSGSCFVVFTPTDGNGNQLAENSKVRRMISDLSHNDWALSFPEGWGAPSSHNITKLVAWKDLDVSSEAKAFSGTVTYTTTFDAGEIPANGKIYLDLGRIDMIAAVSLNGKQLRTLWAPPYRLDLSETIRPGENTLTVEVTSTWFNRLVYDAGKPEAHRKTWTISGPSKDSPLRESGLTGPVVLYMEN